MTLVSYLLARRSRPVTMGGTPKPAVRGALALASAFLVSGGCATDPPPPPVTPAVQQATAAAPYPVSHEAPDKGDRPVGPALAALGEELKRAMATLGKASPPVHHL